MWTSPVLRIVRSAALAIVCVIGLPPTALRAQAAAPPTRPDSAAPTPPRPTVRDTAAKPAAKDSTRVDTAARGVSIAGRVIGLKGYRGTGILVSLTARTTSGDTIWSS